MADIFSSQPGRVCSVTGNGLPLNIFIPNWEGFNGFKAIIQSLGISGRGGFQFAESLRDFIYVYVFGEKPGTLQINGLAFNSICGNSTTPTGIEYIYNFYKQNRITSSIVPITVTIGTEITFTSFLIGVQLGITDPGTNLGSFQLSLMYVPDLVSQF